MRKTQNKNKLVANLLHTGVLDASCAVVDLGQHAYYKGMGLLHTAGGPVP